MRIFLTGATGFIGRHVLPELLSQGHTVIGLTRSDAGARQLAEAGATAHRGSLDDPAGLAAGAAQADAVIHTAFDHDFAHYAENCAQDARVIAALAAELKGSDRPLLVASATGMGKDPSGGPAREDIFDPHHPVPRVATELAAWAALEQGVNVSAVRLPQVHDTHRQGLVSLYIDQAREKGRVAMVGEGQNRWCAAHVSDVARLFAAAIARAAPGARYHAVAEEGVPFHAIAAAVAQGLNLPLVQLPPEDAAAHFGWFAMFAAADMTATSQQTRQSLNWHPTGPGLIADLEAMDYDR